MKKLKRGKNKPGVSRIDIERIKKDFPILQKEMSGKKPAYLDNAATTQKPITVINRMAEFDTGEYATVRRGAYALSEKATSRYEEVRGKIARFIGASQPEEIVITSGATQSINLVASSYGRVFLGKGDEVLISGMEHHANIVPWQIVCREKGATLKVIPVSDSGELVMKEFERLLTSRTKIVAVTHVSNALGTVNPVKEITRKAHEHGAVVLIDGAQAVAHMKVDVKEIGCDFYAFSGHKMYGPTGVGVLYGEMKILETMPPYVSGGDMIETVTFEETTFQKPPHRFEAGTPPISQVIGLGAAIDYLGALGLAAVHAYEGELLEYGAGLLKEIEEVKIIGVAKRKAGIISFVVDGVHPHDLATVLDAHGVLVRAGHHCAQPLMERFGVLATARASFSFYNTPRDLERLAAGVKNAIAIFKG